MRTEPITILAILFLCMTSMMVMGQAPKENTDTSLNLGFDEIIFVKRKPYSSDHYYTDINNGTKPDRFLAGNGIFIYNLRTHAERPVVTAAELPGGKGFIGKISLSFDAQKILFDFRQDPRSGFRIWEVYVDGTGLKQITFPPSDEKQKVKRWRPSWHTDDIHPCYLPNGKIIFSSTRNEHTVLCGGSAALVAPGLHLMDADGSNIEQITKSPVSELCPTVLDDGRVMYHRWEYVDKGSRVCKVLMSMYPDGTQVQELYGMADDTTTVYMYPQQMPGGGNRVVCVGTCHYPQGGCLGSILLVDLQNKRRLRGPDPNKIDPRKMENKSAVQNITPEVFVEQRSFAGWHFKTKKGTYKLDKDGTSGHLFTHPWPVSDKEFLVSYKTKPGDHYSNVANAYDLYLIDIDGKRQRIHEDDQLSCWHPTPLVSRKVPPVISSALNPEFADKKEALCIVTNVNQGLTNVEPGQIKYLRINEAIPRYWDTGRRWKPSNSSSWKAALWPRVQWGIVPVELDGSAYFTVPADRAIFLQALDKDYTGDSAGTDLCELSPRRNSLLRGLPW